MSLASSIFMGRVFYHKFPLFTNRCESPTGGTAVNLTVKDGKSSFLWLWSLTFKWFWANAYQLLQWKTSSNFYRTDTEIRTGRISPWRKGILGHHPGLPGRYMLRLNSLDWFCLNPGNFNTRQILFLTSFSFKTIFLLFPPMTTSLSKDVKFFCASFELCEKFVASCPPTQTPTQMF